MPKFILDISYSYIKGSLITLCKLYADSYMIGGSKNKKKVVGSKASFFCRKKKQQLGTITFEIKDQRFNLIFFPLISRNKT